MEFVKKTSTILPLEHCYGFSIQKKELGKVAIAEGIEEQTKLIQELLKQFPDALNNATPEVNALFGHSSGYNYQATSRELKEDCTVNHTLGIRIGHPFLNLCKKDSDTVNIKVCRRFRITDEEPHEQVTTHFSYLKSGLLIPTSHTLCQNIYHSGILMVYTASKESLAPLQKNIGAR